MNRLRELYFALWAICLPVASVLVIPTIQGTTPGNMLALASIGWLPFLRREKAGQYIKALLLLGGLWLAMVLLAQACLYLFDNPLMPQVLAVDYLDTRVLLRRSIISQSAYLLACLLTFLFFVFVYQSEWRRYLFWGAWALAVYGIYEWTYFLIMHRTGDFIANRTFLGGEHPGSWSQIYTLGKLELLRIKSTTGEPSFLALAGLPYLALAIESRKWPLVAALSFCLIFSLSTTAYLTLIVIAIFTLFYFKMSKGRLIVLGGSMVVVAAVFVIAFPEVFHNMFAQKLAGEGSSGSLRQHVFLLAWEYWTRLGFFGKLFGIGFGSAFVTPLLGGILVNTGLVGVCIFLGGFLYPVFKLPNTRENWGLKAALLALLFMLSVSVADFTYLTTWMIIGLAYRRLRQLYAKTAAPRADRSQTGARVRTRVAPPVSSAGPAVS